MVKIVFSNVAMKYTTLILEPIDYSKDALTTYRRVGPVYFFSELDGERKEKVLRSAHIVVVRLKYTLDEKWFSQMPNLKIIATPTTGLNHIDMDAAKKRGIRVMSLRGHSSFLKSIPSTAEETMALALALVRKIPWAFEDIKKGNWNRDVWKGHQLIGKTFGIVGCGRLGKITAKYAGAFGMRVIGYDPYVNETTMKRYGIKKVSLETLLTTSDIVTLHILLTDETRECIKEKHFQMMKKTAHLINTARAEIIERNALIQALKQKWIAGAAIDVMWDEEGKGRHLKKDPLWNYAKTHSNLIIVPHIGGATYEAMHITEEFIAKQVVEELGSR
ncbi:MAG: hypothetical protein G01um101433_312 [Parcubacteria group bacterium Gr01-1014_33]|nr:MAG: hypothetical protein G01um101433_312 [Parcubacteria group bacterium Gr01-1014_33]